jgi:hypothetical protein
MLQCILEVTWDQLHNTQDERTAEANKSQRPIDPAITAGMKVVFDT